MKLPFDIATAGDSGMDEQELWKTIEDLQSDDVQIASKAALKLGNAYEGQSAKGGVPRPGLMHATGALQRGMEDEDRGVWLKRYCEVALETIRGRA